MSDSTEDRRLGEGLRLTESYMNSLYYVIKRFDSEKWKLEDGRRVEAGDIHMDLPQEAKLAYCAALNGAIAENGGRFSAAFCFDEAEAAVRRRDTDAVFHVHHINLRELAPDETRVLSNQMVVTTAQHIALHKALSEACQRCVKSGQPYDAETVKVCVGAYKKAYQNASDMSASELSNINIAAKAGNVGNARGFSFSELALASNKKVDRGIAGKIPDKRVYLFAGYPSTAVFADELDLGNCLNEGKPFDTITAAGEFVNRNKGRISWAANANSEIISAGKLGDGLHAVQGRDADGNNTGEVYIPVFASDFDALKGK